MKLQNQKKVGQNQLPPLPPSKKMKKTASFILEPFVMNETVMHPQAYRAENSRYGQGEGKAAIHEKNMGLLSSNSRQILK